MGPSSSRAPSSLGCQALVLSPSAEPSDAALRIATLLARPDGGHTELLVTRPETEPAPDRTVLRRLEARISRHGFDGHVRIDVNTLGDALTKALLTGEPSLVIVDNPTFDAAPGGVPL